MICCICPRACDLSDGQTGFCMGRSNTNGQITAKNYGCITSLAIDPIEKKPFARFLPGSFVLSIGSYGCNLRCPYCQNHYISMTTPPLEHMRVMRPEELASLAAALAGKGNIGLAFTYNEPLIGYEFVMDTSTEVRKTGLKNVLVTNGMICDEPLLLLLPNIDAINVDLKGFTSGFYDWVFGDGYGHRGLKTVKNTIMKAAGYCHVEVTTLIIPGRNDSETEIRALSSWLASVNRSIPLHISRYHPDYKYFDSLSPSVSSIDQLVAVALESLDYVYRGNC